MKKLLLAFFAFVTFTASAQLAPEKVVGTWKTYDDKTGREASIVKIFKATNGMYYGKIIDLLDGKDKNEVCTACKGEEKDKPVIGLIFMKGMKIDGNVLRGSLLDPASGKTYYGTITVETEDKLKLRGSLDQKGLFGRTQYWVRVK